MTAARERNVAGLESPAGFRTFRLLEGGIETSEAEVIVVSSHANPRGVPRGTALAALGFHDGIPRDQLVPLLLMAPGSPAGTYRVKAPSRPPGRALLVVRLPGPHAAATDDPHETFDDALWSLFGSLSALELKGMRFRSLAMPVLGGSRGYDVRELLRRILRRSLDWLARSDAMERIDLHGREPEHLALWDAAMDEVLGRSARKQTRSVVVEALAEEIRAHVACLPWLEQGELAHKVRAPLLRALGAQKTAGAFHCSG